jgi:glycosyltransferase involved in cell wall biosynthesis
VLTRESRPEAHPAIERQVRVLFLNSRDSLGADVAVHLSLIRSLDRAEADVSVCTSRYEAPHGTSVRRELSAVRGLDVRTIDLGRPLSNTRGVARFVAAAANSLLVMSVIRLGWACRRRRVEIVHVTDRPRDVAIGWAVSRLGGARLLVHAHTNYYSTDRYGVRNRLLRSADAVVGVSRFTTSTYRDAGFASDRLYSVLNAVDSSIFSPVAKSQRNEFRERIGVPDGVPLVGCVARLMRWKCQPALLDAFASARNRLPGAMLVLVGTSHDVSPDGNGDYRDFLVRRVAELGLQDAVVFAGFIPPSDMPTVYAALDVLVHPAVDEPFGLVIAEAMASGVPVVAVDNGGVPEIIRNGVDGLLVSPEPAALANALEQVLSSPELASHLADSGRVRVIEAFGPSRQAKEMLSTYRAILKPGKLDPGSSQPSTLESTAKGGL